LSSPRGFRSSSGCISSRNSSASRTTKAAVCRWRGISTARCRKLNYRIHTDAVKAHLIPPEVTPAQAAITYANEADLLNVALFGHTARQWRDANPKLEGNVRDYASVEQLLVLANMEGMNAEFIHMGLAQGERLKRLNQIAIRQMQVLTSSNLKTLPGRK
jgi:hypothetical protein